MRRLSDRVLRPMLRLLPAETAHRLTIQALKLGLGGAAAERDDPILACRVWNRAFPNPVGLAAGFDKHAEVADAMLALGFGFVEVGTVTPLPQAGNPRPRLFRLSEDEAVINRFGFNSAGLEMFAARLARRRGRTTGIVGANLGQNRDTADAAGDYERGVTAICGLADYLVINVSSPNTPGLRALQARQPIEALLTRVIEARRRAIADAALRPPLLAKVGPDLDDAQMGAIADVALAVGIDGLIVGNTTIARAAGLRSAARNEAGGLSGRPLMAASTACLAAFYRLTDGRLPLIGCGGIASGDDAYAKIRAGASLVQLYSALVFQGGGLVDQIKRDLVRAVRADGFASIGEAVGADHRRATPAPDLLVARS
jgi:dihydroorotate dehydrogenase